MSEHKIQSDSFRWNWNTFPQYRRLLFHVNNKSKNAIEGNKMKALGAVAGIPDMIYAFGPSTFVGIEFKIEDGKLSADQKTVHEKWNEHGIKIYICRSFEQFKLIIKEIHSTV